MSKHVIHYKNLLKTIWRLGHILLKIVAVTVMFERFYGRQSYGLKKKKGAWPILDFITGKSVN